jgi:hypothetical protein
MVVFGGNFSRLSISGAIVCTIAALSVENVRAYTWDLFPVAYLVRGEHRLANRMIGAEVTYGPLCDDFVISSHAHKSLLAFIHVDVLVLILVLILDTTCLL